MLKYITLIVLTVFSSSLLAQRDLTPRKRRDAFGGKRDFGNYKPYGIQLSLGPTYTLTRGDRPSYTVLTPANTPRYTHSRNPIGGLGGFLEIGMAHFPMSGRKKTGSGKSFRIVSYYDWGIGLQVNRGKEESKFENFNSDGEVANETESVARWNNTYATGRFSAHHNTYFGKRWFLDQALGFNFDYRLQSSSQNHSSEFVYMQQNFQGTSAFQLHYGIGMGYKLSRRSFLISSLQAPVLGLYEWNGGNPSTKWFSSSYWPTQLRIKLIYLFKDKSVDCNGGSEEDRKRNKEYMQNR
mgnify:CR=1 FL=1